MLLLACGACATARPRGAVVFAETPVADLPTTCDALHRFVDAAAVGPAGPDLVNAYRAAEQAGRQSCGPNGEWRTKRALYLLSLQEDVTQREAVLDRCISLPMMSGGPAEVDYYHALCLGMRALDNKTEGLGLIKKMVEAGSAALHKSPTAVHGGPHRLLGGVYLRAPGWPLSVGDVDLALEHLAEATRLASSWPENFLLYAEALNEDDRPDEARAALDEAKRLMASMPAGTGWRRRWKRDVDKLEKELNE